MKRILGLSLLAVLATCAPAAAAAQKPGKLVRWTYSVVVKGDATYHFESAQPTIGGALTQVDDLTFRWKSKIPKLQLLDGRVLNQGAGKVKLSAVEAKRHLSMPIPEGGVATGDCAGTTATAGPARIVDGLLAPLGKRKDGSLDHTPFTSVNAPFECTGRLFGPGAIALSDTTERGPAFDIVFDLPEEAIGMGKVIELFDKRSYGCPAQSRDFMTKCDFRMKGTITLRRVGKKVLGPKGR